jgi:methyl-accepting chemotaxis protein
MKLSAFDYDAAIAAHRAWAERLLLFIDGTSREGVTAALAGDHTVCVFGRWLYGSGKDNELFREYHEVVQAHRSFHETAAQIVRLQEGGDSANARRLLGQIFMEQSDAIVQAMQKMRIDGGPY